MIDIYASVFPVSLNLILFLYIFVTNIFADSQLPIGNFFENLNTNVGKTRLK